MGDVERVNHSLHRLISGDFFHRHSFGPALYYVVSELFGSSSSEAQYKRSRDAEEEVKPLPPPVQLGEITEEELRGYDGADPDKPLLMAIKGQIYDVSQSRLCLIEFNLILNFVFFNWIEFIC